MKFEESERKMWATYRAAKAPPFLWTRVLAAIEAQEAALQNLWWGQWRWISRMTAAATVVVGLTIFFLYRNASENLEPLLETQPRLSQPLQLASLPSGYSVPHTAPVGDDGWVPDTITANDDAIILTGETIQ